MEKIDTQALNKKLAEWVWSKNGIEVHGDGKYIYYHTKWHEAEQEWGIEIAPYFTQSLDAIFKWLVPEEAIVILGNESAYIYCVHNGYTEDYWGYDKSLATALGLAIEKLIDSER